MTVGKSLWRPGRVRACFFMVCAVWSGWILHAQPKVILKLDDLEARPSSFDACLPTFEFLERAGIKAGWGVMKLEDISDDRIAILKKYLGKTTPQGEPLFEFWHHGLDHSRDTASGTWEFSGTPYAYQKAHFDSASRILKEILGITVRTFGAPYNHSDATLLQVASEDSNMKVILLGEQIPSSAERFLNLHQRVNMERSTGVVSFDYFAANYSSRRTTYTDYIVLQGHPAKWATPLLQEEFRRIVTFLISEGCKFVTPYEYYCFGNGVAMTPPAQDTPRTTP